MTIMHLDDVNSVKYLGEERTKLIKQMAQMVGFRDFEIRAGVKNAITADKYEDKSGLYLAINTLVRDHLSSKIGAIEAELTRLGVSFTPYQWNAEDDKT